MVFTIEQKRCIQAANKVLLALSGSMAEIAFLYLHHVVGVETIQGIVSASTEVDFCYGLPVLPNTSLSSLRPGTLVLCNKAFSLPDHISNCTHTIEIDTRMNRAMRSAYAEWLRSWLIRDQPEVILYGAGWYARTLGYSLQEKPFHSKVMFLMTTESPAIPAEVLGTTVIGVNETGEKFRDTPVLIATDERAHSAIMNTLRQRGFTRIFPQTFEAVNDHVRHLAEGFLHESTDYRIMESPFTNAELLIWRKSQASESDVERIPHWIFRSAVTAQWDIGKKLLSKLNLVVEQNKVYGCLPMLKLILAASAAGVFGEAPSVYMAQSGFDAGVEDTAPSYRSLIPLHVGAALCPPASTMLTDDTGDNISVKNNLYSEVTGVYWLWRNAPVSEYIGLCHYRRHFNLTPDDLAHIPQTGLDIIVSVLTLCVPNNREFFIWSGYLGRELFSLIDATLRDFAIDYVAAYQEVCDSPLLIPCNMAIMRRFWFDKYCAWLFPLAEELEKRVAVAGLATSRYMGYVTEILLSTFFAHHKNDIKAAVVDRIVIT